MPPAPAPNLLGAMGEAEDGNAQHLDGDVDGDLHHEVAVAAREPEDVLADHVAVAQHQEAPAAPAGKQLTGRRGKQPEAEGCAEAGGGAAQQHQGVASVHAVSPSRPATLTHPRPGNNYAAEATGDATALPPSGGRANFAAHRSEEHTSELQSLM